MSQKLSWLLAHPDRFRQTNVVTGTWSYTGLCVCVYLLYTSVYQGLFVA